MPKNVGAVPGKTGTKGVPVLDPTPTLADLGELLADMPKAKGAAAGGKKDGPRGTYVEPRDPTPTLADLGELLADMPKARGAAGPGRMRYPNGTAMPTLPP